MVSILLDYIIPGAGTLLSNGIVMSSYPAMAAVIKSGFLGEMNPIPFPIQVINNLSWCIYAIAISNYWVFLSNAPALPLGLYFTLHSFRLASRQTADLLFYILGSGVFLSLILGALAGFSVFSLDMSQTVFGFFANFWALLVYGAGISSISEVVKTKNSNSINANVLTVLILNGSLWTVYGLVQGKLAIALPNIIGIGLSLFQVLLIILYPKVAVSHQDKLNTLNENPVASNEPAIEVELMNKKS